MQDETLDCDPALRNQFPARYEVLGELGRGGMGIVYKARDRETGEVLALKVLIPDTGTDAEAIELLKKELLLAHQITHHNVARLYEFHRSGDAVYLSMEYVEGETLRAVLRRTGKLEIPRALHIGRQLAVGLAEAHRRSIAHRDLKPENIMLGAGDELKVMDFGISRSYAAGATATGSVIGTPSYMAPEQLEGRPIDQRADIYAFGLILYEMVTGAKTFRAENPVLLAMKQLQEAPKPPRQLTPELPEWLERAILQCLEKDPARRFQSMDEFLQSIDGGTTASAAAQPARRLSRRTVAAGAAAAIPLAAGGWWLARSVHEERSIAVLPFEDLSPEKNQKYFSEGLAVEILDALAKIPSLRVAAKTSSFQFGGRDDSRVIGRRLNVAILLEGSVRQQGNLGRINVRMIQAANGFHVWSESYDRELNNLFAVQADIARAVTGSLSLKLSDGKAGQSAGSTNGEAYKAYLQGRYLLDRRTKANLEKATGFFRHAIQLDAGYARAWVGLSECLSNQANSADIPTEAGYRDAREAVRQALALDANLAEAHVTLGRILMFHEWDWAGADAAFRRTQALEPGGIRAIGSAAMLARVLGRADESVALSRRALAIDPLNPSTYHNAGIAFYNAGLNGEAAAAFRKALELVPEKEITHDLLGQVYLAQSRPELALAEADKEKNAALRLSCRALAFHALGRRRESDGSLGELIGTFAREAPFEIAEVYAFRGEAGKAFEWLERAYAERDPGVTQIKGDPLLKSLRGDPRFGPLLRKIGLSV